MIWKSYLRKTWQLSCPACFKLATPFNQTEIWSELVGRCPGSWTPIY